MFCVLPLLTLKASVGAGLVEQHVWGSAAPYMTLVTVCKIEDDGKTAFLDPKGIAPVVMKAFTIPENHAMLLGLYENFPAPIQEYIKGKKGPVGQSPLEAASDSAMLETPAPRNTAPASGTRTPTSRDVKRKLDMDLASSASSFAIKRERRAAGSESIADDDMDEDSRLGTEEGPSLVMFNV